MEILSLKSGFSAWNKWYRFLIKTMNAWHTVISEEIGGSLQAVPWLRLSLTASRISCLRMFLRRDHQLGIPCWETPIDRYGVFLRSFLRRKHHFGYCFSDTNILWFVYSFAWCKQRRPLGGSSWKLLELTSVSWFLSYVTRPLNGESVWLVKKTSCEVKNLFMPIW
jgi:hypothetical protein